MAYIVWSSKIFDLYEDLLLHINPHKTLENVYKIPAQPTHHFRPNPPTSVIYKTKTMGTAQTQMLPPYLEGKWPLIVVPYSAYGVLGILVGVSYWIRGGWKYINFFFN